MIRRIAVLGEFGTGNLGDDYGYILLRDALYAAFAELDVLVGIYPLSGQAGIEMNTWHAVVTGCGTLLDEVRGNYVHRLLISDCPVAILGTGTADPRYAIPTREGARALRNALKLSVYTWRRGVEGPDTGWLAGWCRPEGVVGEGVVGINEGPAAHNLAPMEKVLLRVIREKLQHPSLLVAAFPADLAHLSIASQPEDAILMVDGTRKSFAALAQLSRVYCRRIHLGVMAACCGVHPVLLDYSAKVRQVFAGTSVAHTVMPRDWSAESLAAVLNEDQPLPSKESVEEAQAACLAHVRAAAQAIVAEWVG